jgi:hypothetical protein
MNKNLIALIVAVAVVVGSQVQLASADDQSSGCGLGWQVSQKNSLLSSAVRLTTDTILPNSFSMTFGTSGCAQHTIVKNDEKAVEYAVNNYDSIVVEMAEGHGEFLQGFAQALGCSGSASSSFGSFTQSRYQKIIDSSNRDGIDLYRAVRTQLESSDLSGQCIPSV